MDLPASIDTLSNATSCRSGLGTSISGYSMYAWMTWCKNIEQKVSVHGVSHDPYKVLRFLARPCEQWYNIKTRWYGER